MTFWLLLCVAVFSLLLTGLLRRYAMVHSLMDVPNKRSSHTVATPRGGGMAIVLAFLLALILLWLLTEYSTKSFWSIFISGALIALIGFMDDHAHIPARWRLLAHFISGVWAVAWLGGLPPLPISGIFLDLGMLGNLLAVVYLVWLVNLYNFMDGIDGIASIEAVTVCLGGAVLYGLAETSGSEWEVPLVLMAAVVGFLFWNFPKAQIFMGDAGSGFIGIVLGVFSIQAAWVTPKLFWGWVILLGAFVVDATVTLVRRLLCGDKIYEAHHSHAYQYASRKYGAHQPITLAFGAINLFWLLPVASLVTLDSIGGLHGIVIAYAPLVWLAYRFKAGSINEQEL